MVLSLRAHHEDWGRDVECFLHMGFVNFKTWKMSTMLLHPHEQLDLPEDTVSLRVVDLNQDDLDEILACDDDRQAMLDEVSDGVQTLCEALCANLHFRFAYDMRLWVLSESEKGRPPASRTAGSMQAILLADVGNIRVWKGSELETAERERPGHHIKT